MLAGYTGLAVSTTVSSQKTDIRTVNIRAYALLQVFQNVPRETFERVHTLYTI